VCNALPILRFVFPDPQQFREGEVSKWRVAGKLNQPIHAEQFRQLSNLSFRPLIAPDDGGSHDLVARIEQDGTVHLSRESDAVNSGSAGAEFFQRPRHGMPAGSPPIPRILFCPSQLRRLKRLMVCGSGRNHRSPLVNDESARPAGADIDAEAVNVFS
jgi:hypothetical protein